MGNKLLFGLSANPPHEGHRQLLVAVVGALAARGVPLAELVLMPVYQRHQTGDIDKGALSANYEERVAWCWGLAEAVAEEIDADGVLIGVSQLERGLALARGGPNYTVETLAHLQAEGPTDQWFVLLSSDLVSGAEPEIGRWYETTRLPQLATVVVCVRPGYPVNERFLAEWGGNGRYLLLDDLPPLPAIASRALRARLAAGECGADLARAGLVPWAVAQRMDEALRRQ
ncbi:MAG TPA: hypothetical protein VLL52_07325 [Anaerolineae bacterium]|nr:hypothetical protein [Anaerolineae bacterium]